MVDAVAGWLDGVGAMAFRYSAWAFVLLNVAGLAVVAWKRDRDLVNRWTSRLLVANLVLLGTGLGVPLAALAARTALVTLAPAVHVLTPTTGESFDEDESVAPVRRP